MAKHTELPGVTGVGVSPVRIAAIDKLAEAYIKERDKRLVATPKEVAAKTKLIDALHDHEKQIGRQPDGALVYRYDEMEITLTPGREKLKVADLEGTEED